MRRHTYPILLFLTITWFLINMLILQRPKNVRYKLKTFAASVDGSSFMARMVTENERASSLEYLEKNLESEIAADDWTECELPVLDVFDAKIVEFEKSNAGPKMEPCPSNNDWVDCSENQHQTFCGIDKKATSMYTNVVCTMYCVQSYGDTDDMITLSKLSTLKTANLRYSLGNSDIAKFECTAIGNKDNVSYQWNGTKIGFRKFDYPEVKPTTENNFEPNILILALGSMSTNGFIRQMPKSYKTLEDDLEAVFLKGYSMIETNRDANIQALLTGKTELELRELRKRMPYQSAFVDDILFLIDTLKINGYRTMFVEDLDDKTGTFTERLNGYVTQPTHHFLYMYNSTDMMKGNCYGDSMRHSFVINLTNRFFKLKGKKFGFALISGENSNKSANYRWSDVDEELSQFLHNLFKDGVLNSTMLFVLSDQGARFPENDPDLYQGHIEQRLPLMAIRLPNDMLTLYADQALNANFESITTPFDVYRTILHLVDLGKNNIPESYYNKTITGARFPRGMSLLNRIPSSRSCAEAGVQPYWCVCLKRTHLSPNDVMYQRVPQEFVGVINELREDERSETEPIELATVENVMKKSFHDQLINYNGSDIDGYLPIFVNKTAEISYYHFKVILNTGIELIEVSVPYLAASDQLLFNKSTVSATV